MNSCRNPRGKPHHSWDELTPHDESMDISGVLSDLRLTYLHFVFYRVSGVRACLLCMAGPNQTHADLPVRTFDTQREGVSLNRPRLESAGMLNVYFLLFINSADSLCGSVEFLEEVTPNGRDSRANLSTTWKAKSAFVSENRGYYRRNVPHLSFCRHPT